MTAPAPAGDSLCSLGSSPSDAERRTILRQIALDAAIRCGHRGAEVVPVAQHYERFLCGEASPYDEMVEILAAIVAHESDPEVAEAAHAELERLATLAAQTKAPKKGG